MLRTTEGISPMANLGQLRRYLTSTPQGQRTGYETAWRVIVMLRLTGHVLSELYQVHDTAMDFRQACALTRAFRRFFRPP